MEHFTPDFRPVRINDVLQKEIALLHEHLDEKEIRIVNYVPESLICNTDENFLAVIIRNLLQNAVKYSDGDRLITISSTGHGLAISNPTAHIAANLMNGRLNHTAVDSAHSGLGLQIAADLAARIQATLTFRQTPSPATNPASPDAGSAGAPGPAGLTAVLDWEPAAVSLATHHPPISATSSSSIP